MATRKKPKKNRINSGKKAASRKKSKSSSSSRSRKVLSKGKTAKSQTARTKRKARTIQAKVTKNAKPRIAAAGKTLPRNTRIIGAILASRGEGQSVETINLDPKGLGSKSGGQSGALQGLSDIEGASSESVDELLEEGNAFEAEVVKGVEDAPDADEGEVRTHQRPQEEDLPEDFREN
jgi:N utilization substance protein A